MYKIILAFIALEFEEETRDDIANTATDMYERSFLA